MDELHGRHIRDAAGLVVERSRLRRMRERLVLDERKHQYVHLVEYLRAWLLRDKRRLERRRPNLCFVRKRDLLERN